MTASLSTAWPPVVFGDAGGQALVGGFFVFLALIFIGLGLLVGLVVFLIARSRARKRLEQAPPPSPPNA